MAFHLASNASWCDLKEVGQQLNFGYYSVAFSKSRAVSGMVQALNVLMTDSIEKSELHDFHTKHFPVGTKRELCGADDAASAGDAQTLSLSVTQVAGLFLLAAVTLVAAAILHVTVDARRRAREWDDVLGSSARGRRGAALPGAGGKDCQDLNGQEPVNGDK